jgi:excisionase family DNA binding protein
MSANVNQSAALPLSLAVATGVIDETTNTAEDRRDAIAADAVATLLGVNRKTVYDAASRGQLPSRRLGRRLLFSRSAVLAWLQCKASSESVR